MHSRDDIAPDAWPLIKAFRRGGSNSFEKLGVDDARASYERSCVANGINPVAMATVVDRQADADLAIPVRIYTPITAPACPPAILFLHGGGWVFGSLDSHDSICRTLAHESAAQVVAVDYRLAPEAPFPAAIDDARAALAWLVHASTPAGHRPAAIAIAGDSAGGGLAAVLANEYSGPATLAAQVLLYPVTDLTMTTASHRRVTTGFPLVASTMEWFAGLYAGDADRRDHR